ncbi:MAG TPA: ATP-binding protein [Candidatus Methylomirabilis sp.]
MRLPDLALESLSAGLIVCDREGAIAYANPAGASALGREVEGLVGHHLESAMGPEAARALPLKDVLVGETQQGREGVWARPDCTNITVGYSISPLRDAGGTVGGAVILFREISEADRLRRNMGRAEALASVGILASGIAHQIRNPLAGIRSTVQGLQRKLAPAGKEWDRLHRVLAEIDRINNLIKSLLDFARPKASTFEIIDIGSFLDEALGLIGPAMDRAGVTVEREADPPRIRLRADRQRLQEALLNVLLNAVQAMPQGGKVRLQTSLEGGGGDGPLGVAIQISDTGPGVPPEQAERIFKPFYTTRPDGTGLGLAVVRQVVEEHGGSVAVRCSPGEGATFVVRLPLGGEGRNAAG